MTVKELIDRLNDMPPDAIVWHDGGGDGYMAAEVIKVELDTAWNGEWSGGSDPPRGVRVMVPAVWMMSSC